MIAWDKAVAPRRVLGFSAGMTNDVSGVPTAAGDGGPNEDYVRAFRQAAVDLVLIAVNEDGSFSFLDANDTHRANTGLALESFVGRTPQQALPAGTGDFALAKYRECVATGDDVAYQQLGRFPSGERMRRSFITPLRNAAGRIDRLLLTAIDLTELHAMPPELRQSQKLEAMGQLAGGLAHDFNNLLAAIVGNLELLSLKLHDPDLQRRVDTALQAAARGERLTRQLLAFARPPKLPAPALDPNAVIGAMLDLLRRSLGGLIQIEADLQPGLWPSTAEAAQLEQAILNLAINARDAMPRGGRLTIATRNAPAGSPGQPAAISVGDYVVVSVTDEGIGMTPEVIERAIEPFFTTKPVGKGTGLGLAQVYGFARQFGGTLRIESAVGRGTSIAIILPRGTLHPVLQPPEGGTTMPASGAPHPRSLRILVVDNEADVREAAIDLLIFAGHDAIGAESASAALAMLAQAPADVVLADLAMPDMSGAELIRRLHVEHPRVRSVLMTGNAEGLDEAPNHLVLAKPFGLRDLLRAVEETTEAS